MSTKRKPRVAPTTPSPTPPAPDSVKAGNEGASVGTGTPLARAPLPPSSGQAGAKKG